MSSAPLPPSAAMPADEDTPLARMLAAKIKEQGPISVATFMRHALSDTEHGYYATQTSIGAEGDFTTAPEISQIFGELIGAWLIDSWISLGEPSRLHLVELGPGRGTLMADILRVGGLRPTFRRALKVHLVESSERLRARQQETIGKVGPDVTWHDDLPPAEELSGPVLIVANEFFDCLPIRQYIRLADGRGERDAKWAERLVDLTESSPPSFGFVRSKALAEPPTNVPFGAKPEDIFEVCAAAQNVVKQIADALKPKGGRALIIDYGYARTAFGDTFQAVKHHRFVSPLTAPGKVDVTAHVDFASLARTASDAGLEVAGPVTQSDFLQRLGLAHRLERLVKAASTEEQAKAVRSGAARLVNPDAMGNLFKVIALSAPSLPQPPGFE